MNIPECRGCNDGYDGANVDEEVEDAEVGLHFIFLLWQRKLQAKSILSTHGSYTFSFKKNFF
jgi:hypothetical protein